MDEDIACNSIPVTSFKSNNIQKMEKFMQPVGAMSPGGMAVMNAPLSPGAGFCMIDNSFKQQANSSYLSALASAGGGGANDFLSPRSDGGGVSHCICGNPMRPDQATCEKCEGKGSVHIEGEIIKKQKKGGQLRKYWYVLLGKELYSYKKQTDQKHKDMQSLAGVFIKSEVEELLEDNTTTLYPFMLIFPNKRRIYYLDTLAERD